MSNRKTIFYTVGFIAVAAVVAAAFVMGQGGAKKDIAPDALSTKYGDFLAAQHAVYVNDFSAALGFAKNLSDKEYTTVKNTALLAEFLAGNMPKDIDSLKSEKNTPSRMIYDAYLAKNERWDDLYNRQVKEPSLLFASGRIWSGVAKNRITETLKFVEKLSAAESWKSFIRGQIYATIGQDDKAAAEFARVSTDFMNINDYMYIMSFYMSHNMADAADILRQDFTSTPGGMFMLNYDEIPDWSVFSGYKNALAFSMIQNVSHSQFIIYTDLSVLLLRYAQIVGDDAPVFRDAINYFIGQFIFNTTGDYTKQFDKISKHSPYYLFGQMRIAEYENSVSGYKNILAHDALFIPALNKLVNIYVRDGDKKNALRVIKRALGNKNLGDSGRAYLLKRSAYVNFLFGDLDSAQSELHDAADVLDVDIEVIALQSQIWAAQNREIEDAYQYAMAMIKKNPADVVAWDVVGQVVLVREGYDAAMEIYERVGGTANTCSSLFEHLGDLYVQGDKKELAVRAYERAIELSSDGRVIVPNIEKKLRKLK